jgi:cellulose synthase/poly-beta-1,6-N-acetylglucosamine synthase-like glycosyltransferase
MRLKQYEVSILIPCYNERKNLERLLNALIKQKVSPPFLIREIVVVASGCNDGSEEVVKKFALKDKRVKLLTQQKRDGKASAINFFLKQNSSDIIVMESADTLPEEYAINNLLRPFINSKVGMTGGRPIPLNKYKSLTDRISSLSWHIQHEVSLRCPPKVGEFVAFRKIIEKIPEKTAADEESISAIIQQKGYKVVYVPHAIVYNKAPEKISEFIKQKERIHYGHLWIKKYQHYIVPSLNYFRVAKVLVEIIKKNPLKIFTIFPLALFELFARLLGTIDFYLLKKDMSAWEPIITSKNL